MVIPNTNNIDFIDWLTDDSWYRWSQPQLNLLAIIRAAAVMYTDWKFLWQV